MRHYHHRHRHNRLLFLLTALLFPTVLQFIFRIPIQQQTFQFAIRSITALLLLYLQNILDLADLFPKDIRDLIQLSFILIQPLGRLPMMEYCKVLRFLLSLIIKLLRLLDLTRQQYLLVAGSRDQRSFLLVQLLILRFGTTLIPINKAL